MGREENENSDWLSGRSYKITQNIFSVFLQQIDGEAFLLLNQSDIVNILKIKLGPALKIYNTIPKFWYQGFLQLYQRIRQFIRLCPKRLSIAGTYVFSGPQRLGNTEID